MNFLFIAKKRIFTLALIPPLMIFTISSYAASPGGNGTTGVQTSGGSGTSTTTSITSNVQATATLSAVCTIASQNVNFGLINLPLSSQTASSNMNITCTKGSSYTIDLSYGGVYGQPQSEVFYSLAKGSSTYVITNYPANNTILGQTNTLPSNAVQFANIDPNNYSASWTVGGGYYNYGKMIGSAHGDAIGYSIQVPNKPTEVWNNGNYNYTSTGSGVNQSIPVIATLDTTDTTNSYPTADSYLDTVTATISY